MKREALPIDEHLPAIAASLKANPNLVLEAPTGAGKTTRVPPACLELGSGQIIVVEPRRIAARAAARRMADEQGGRVGELVGYAVRMDARHGPKTRILVVTPGILLRRLLEDPFLEGIDAILFDEFHERGLDADLAAAVARRVQAEVRDDLRLVLMSATLDPGALCRWLTGAAHIKTKGRSYPVTIEHRPVPREARLEREVAAAVIAAHEAVEGNLLVFLPGVGEIRRAVGELKDAAKRRGVELLELYGEMDAAQQDRALQAGGSRRWILATNVAESSVTVHGVVGVIDSGLHRRMEQNERTGLDNLVLTQISKASADQRAGRAGRTAPGHAWRLWSAHEHSALSPHDPAEVSRVDPARALLWLLAFGERDPLAFEWLDPPAETRAKAGLALLRRLGAWHPERGITSGGKAMAQLPMHPRLACLLLEGARLGVLDRAALAVVLCSERWPFENEFDAAEHHSDSDLLDAVEALEGYRDNGTLHAGVRPLKRHAAKTLLRLAERMHAQAAHAEGKPAKDRDDAFLRAVALAFRDRLARRRDSDPTRALFASGGGVRIGEQSAVADAPLFVCVQVVEHRGGAFARVLSCVEEDWYGEDALAQEEQMRFDSANHRIQAFRVRTLDGMSLLEKPVPISDWEAASKCLIEAALKDPDRVWPKDNPAVTSFLERVRFLSAHLPDLEWPDFSLDALAQWLPDLAHGCRSFEDLRKAPWLDYWRAALNAQQKQALSREAPTHITLPKGRNVRLQYDGERAPVLASRIQDFFGLEATPRIAQGRVPVLLHLLAPNRRPQQVTDDLTSFWDNTYTLVRKELRRRYPKHDWPEDPRR